MNQHLSQDELDRYRQQQLNPAQLLAADDHLAACADCRARLATLADVAAHVHFLQREFRPLHLSEEELESWARRQLRDPDALSHLEKCAQCRAEAKEARAPLATRPYPLAWTAVLAVGVLAAIIGDLSMKKPAAPPHADQVRTELPADLRDLREQAIRSGQVEIPPQIARMIHPAKATLRGNAPSRLLKLEAPVATAILTVQPEFRWEPVAGADWYQVAILDPEFRLVEASGRLSATTWPSRKPLEYGRQYLWQITASVRGRQIVAPEPPEQEARFQTLPKSEGGRLAQLAATYSNDHLLLGILYAKAGVLDQARREWQLASAGADADASRRLMDSIEVR